MKTDKSQFDAVASGHPNASDKHGCPILLARFWREDGTDKW